MGRPLSPRVTKVRVLKAPKVSVLLHPLNFQRSSPSTSRSLWPEKLVNPISSRSWQISPWETSSPLRITRNYVSNALWEEFIDLQSWLTDPDASIHRPEERGLLAALVRPTLSHHWDQLAKSHCHGPTALEMPGECHCWSPNKIDDHLQLNTAQTRVLLNSNVRHNFLMLSISPPKIDNSAICVTVHEESE